MPSMKFALSKTAGLRRARAGRHPWAHGMTKARALAIANGVMERVRLLHEGEFDAILDDVGITSNEFGDVQQRLSEMFASFEVVACAHCEEDDQPEPAPRPWMQPLPDDGIVRMPHIVRHQWEPSCNLYPRCLPEDTAAMEAYKQSMAEGLVGWLTQRENADVRRWHCDIGFPPGFDIARYTRILPDTLTGTKHYEQRRDEKGLPAQVTREWVQKARLITITTVEGRLARYAVRGPFYGLDLTVAIDAATGRLVTGYLNDPADWHRLDGSTVYEQP